MAKYVKIDIDSGIATITISKPEVLNALDTQILNELEAAFEELRPNGNVRVVIITGEGRSFVAGADIAEMATLNYEQAKKFGERGASVFRLIEQFRTPVIAAVNGFALGGGCELALACDIRIASDKAKFGQPEVGLGIIPGFSGTQRLTRVVGLANAKELIYSANVIVADEALRIGLVNRVVAQEQLMAVTLELAKMIASRAPLAVANAKEAINAGFDMDIDAAIALENEHFGRCFTTNDQKRGMAAFLKKEKVQYLGD